MADDAQRQPDSTKDPSERGGPERVFVVPYPKVVFLYPTMIVALVAAVWLSFMGERATDTTATMPVVLTSVFLVVLAVNMAVLSVDFPRATSLTLFFVISTLILGGVILFYWNGPVLEEGGKSLLANIRPVANATFYWIVFTILFFMMIVVKIMVQFDYWEFRRNEVLHHHGFLSDLRRYPTAGLQVEKEINDVFEFVLLRSGRLVIRPQGEARAFVLDNVPFISTKEAKLTRLLSSMKVKVQTFH